MNTPGSAMSGTTAGGCGCGGGHRASGATPRPGPAGPGSSRKPGGCGCTCGMSGPAVSGASAFVRPRFFGGMLLTEDDLQAIDDYTVAKRRLTNRHMFGPGVVCGLDVDCDPCKPGWLTVTPGYALDCCGNDIVVGCPEKLDALAMLSDLRRKQGADCDDPCDDQPRRSYLLVVSYAEQSADPVAPYVQDDCAVGDCDFSRVREGYRFELVCDVQDPDPTLIDRLRDCARAGDEETGRDAEALTRVARLAGTQAKVAAAEQSGEAPALAIPLAREFDAARKEGIGSTVNLLGRSTAVLAAAAAHDAKRGPAIGLTASRRKAISDHSRKLAEELLASGELNGLPEIDRQRFTVVLDAARDQQDLDQLTAGQRLWLTEGYEPADAARAFVTEAEDIRSRIVRKLEQTGRGNCREREEVERLPLHRLDAYSGDTVWRLAQSFWSIVVGCLCDSVNPPCPLCTETRVPLATVRIEGCEVVDVCGLDRHWVPAPRTLNYWFPIVDELRRLLLGRCCTRGLGYRPTTGQEIETLRGLAMQALSLVRSPLDAPEFQALRAVLTEPAAASAAVAPTPAAAAAAPAAGAAPGPADPRGETLEKKVAELSEQLRKLTSGGTP